MATAEAARRRQPLAIAYTRRAGHASQRTFLPYRIVARCGH